MSDRLLAVFVGVPCTALFGWLLNGLRTGMIEFPQAGFTMSGRREDQPVRFWLTAIVLGFLTLMMAVGSIAAFFWPNGL